MTGARIARRASFVALAGGFAMASLGVGPVQAHHSYSMFDSSQTLTIEGVFAEFEWKNPHAHLWLYVENANEPGGQQLWSFENGSPLVLARLGWSKDTPSVGEHVTVEYWPLRSGGIGGHCRNIRLADGRTFDCPSDLGGVSPREAAARAAEDAAAATRAASPAASYAALDALPDIAGWWVTDASSPPPRLSDFFTPDATAAMQAELARRRSGETFDRGYCAPPSFQGTNGQGFELLLNPGRVTLANEAGLVRRLYLLDAPPPGSLDESTAGVSIARWEGQELVVETTGLFASASVAPGVMLGPDARVLERFSLVEPNVLEVVAEVTAPAIFAGPVAATRRYLRDPGHVFTEFETCVADDRAFDHETGLERFETSPPAGLSPPSSE